MQPSCTQISQHLNTLCIDIGTRHVGSRGEAEAADYIQGVFADQGYATVTDTYPVTGWNCDSYSLLNRTTGESLDMRPCFFSNGGDIEGPLYWITPREIESLSATALKGQLCMVNMATETGKVFGRNIIAERLDAMGAAGAIFISEHYHAINTKIQRSPFLDQLVTASVSGAVFDRLSRRPHDSYRLQVSAEKFHHSSSNIIARVPGEGPRHVVGAHYDTAPLISGASDNASGIAALLALSHTLKNRIQGPIDFVAFSAEEYIPDTLPPGSADYVARYQEEGIRWFLNYDSIGMYGGQDEVQLGLPEQLPVIPKTNLPTVPYSGAGDDKSFHAAHIPTLWVYTQHPFKRIHTHDDTVDRLCPQRISELVATSASIIDQLYAAERETDQ